MRAGYARAEKTCDGGFMMSIILKDVNDFDYDRNQSMIRPWF